MSDKAVNGDTYYTGVSMIRRYDIFNIAIRDNSSIAADKTTAASTNGSLLSGEFSFSPWRSEDIVYFNPYVAFGTFTQASRDPTVSGPLGPLGILYAGYGIGTIASPLSSAAQDVAGFALGYEAFWDEKRRNLTIELGGRELTAHTPGNFNALGIGAQFQQALTKRVVLQLNATAAAQENHTSDYGLRGEILVQF